MSVHNFIKITTITDGLFSLNIFTLMEDFICHNFERSQLIGKILNKFSKNMLNDFSIYDEKISRVALEFHMKSDTREKLKERRNTYSASILPWCE